MIVYRICKEKYSKDLTGIGAERYGGRWNSVGYKMIYTACSIALAILEVAVHLPLGIVPEDYVIVTIEVPESVKSSVIIMGNDDWKNTFDKTREIGNSFIDDGNNIMLHVPSAIASGEINCLLNPNHKDFKKIKIIKIEPFSFDSRLFYR